MSILKDKIIIVTGASAGMGAATAVEAAREGARVVLADVNEEKGAKIVARIREAGGQALFVRTDVTREEDIKNLVERTVAEHGRLDGAFNNAGTVSAVGCIADLSLEDYKGLMAVNLDSVFLCMKYEIQQMKQAGAGSIVNCASILGMVTGPTFGVYTATKHGVVGLTKAAAVEYAAAGIRVNAVLPGAVHTDVWGKFPNGEATLNAFVAGTPLKRAAQPEEIARPVAFLLSDGASFISGAQMVIDGAYTAV